MSVEGWSNYGTWNVMLWLNNDYGLYTRKEQFFAQCDTAPTYRDLIKHMRLKFEQTHDGIKFDGPHLNLEELDTHLALEWRESKAYREEKSNA